MQGFENNKEGGNQGTLIGEHTQIIGDLLDEGSLRVEGTVKGHITAKEKVVIGASGSIKGNVTAPHIILYGKVEGNVEAEGLLEIKDTGYLKGDMHVSHMSIAQGGRFYGISEPMEHASKLVDLSKSTSVI